MLDQGLQRLSDVHVASHNLLPLVLGRRVAVSRRVVTEIGEDDTHGKRRCVDLGTQPIDRVAPVHYGGVLINGPILGHVGWENKLEEAEVGETVDRDGISEEIRCSETLVWVALLSAGGFRVPWWFVLLDWGVQGPERPRLDIVNNEMVTREEDKLGIAV